MTCPIHDNIISNVEGPSGSPAALARSSLTFVKASMYSLFTSAKSLSSDFHKTLSNVSHYFLAAIFWARVIPVLISSGWYKYSTAVSSLIKLHTTQSSVRPVVAL